jgi:hypothetical protein
MNTLIDSFYFNLIRGSAINSNTNNNISKEEDSFKDDNYRVFLNCATETSITNSIHKYINDGDLSQNIEGGAYRNILVQIY